MYSFNLQNLLIAVSFLFIIKMVNSSCEIYDSLDWSNDDINFKAISGIYTVVQTNYREIFSACEVHGISQEVDGSILDRFKINGSPCSSVFQNHITKTANAFQFQFFADDLNCMPPTQYRSVDNMKMKVTPNGDCFFKSFCLPNGATVINLLCRNPGIQLLNWLLIPIINAVFALLNQQSIFYIDQSCYYQTTSNQTALALLNGQI